MKKCIFFLFLIVSVNIFASEKDLQPTGSAEYLSTSFSFSSNFNLFERVRNYSTKSEKLMIGKSMRNTGIVLFSLSMVSFVAFIACDIAAILLSEEEILFPDGNYDASEVRTTQLYLWGLTAFFAATWIIMMVPGIILMAIGANLVKKYSTSKGSFKEWFVEGKKDSIATGFVISM